MAGVGGTASPFLKESETVSNIKLNADKKGMTVQFRMENEKYRVILHRIGGNTEAEKTCFCGEVSENYIPLSLMRKIGDRCAIAINLTYP